MQDKTDAIYEIAIAERALRQCKWYEFIKKNVLKAYIDVLKFIHEI